MAEALRRSPNDERALKIAVATVAGEVWQLPDGKAAYADQLTAGAVNDRVCFRTEGIVTVPKTSSVVIVDGQPVYWDRSADSATYAPASDRDFFLGSAVGDAASADTTMEVNVNVWPHYKIDINRGNLEDACVMALVGTLSLGLGLSKVGGSNRMAFSTTAEAQKIDILSKQGWVNGANAIIEGGFTIVDDGSGAAIDFNIGFASATHASDADAIATSVFLHMDGNDLNIFAESDDGTTEVAATDTTKDLVLGTPVHFVMDARDPADVQIYINGVLVLTASVFNINANTLTLYLLAHLEKSSDAMVGEYYVDYLRVRTMEQDGVQLVNA